MNKTAILILAAGASVRMGKIKQLLPYNDTTILGHVINAAVRSGNVDVYCVLGAHREKITEGVNFEGVQTVYNMNWEQGLGASISFGLKCILEKEPKTWSVMILLGDQPKIDREYLNRILRAHSEHQEKIIASNYGKHYGVPALFPKEYFYMLSDLKHDNGAGKFINDHPELIFPINNWNNLLDVDTPEAYRELLHKINNPDNDPSE